MTAHGFCRRLGGVVIVAVTLGQACPAQADLEVHLHGVESAVEANVKAQLGILSYADKLGGKPPDPAKVKELSGKADSQIRRALQPFGWYTPTIRDGLQHKGKNWVARYDIKLGPPTEVTEIEIKLTGPGADESKLKHATYHWPLKVGKQLNHQDYATVKQRVQAAAKNQGYLKAHYTRHELRVDPAKRSAQVFLTLETGKRFYFGKITIKQEKPRLQEAMIRRYLKIYQGAPFKPDGVLSTQFALSDLGYFSTVEVEPQSDKITQDRHVPVVVRLSYAKPFVFRFGAGYGTDTGARALAGVKWRRVNSRGDTFSFDVRPAQKISSAVARYGIPFGREPGQKYQFTVQGLEQSFRGIDEKLYSLGIARIKFHGYLQRKYYLRYLNDTYTIGGEPQQHSSLLMPGVTFSHTTVDRPNFPRHGWYAYLDIHGATKQDQVSSANFISTHLRLKGVLPLGWRWRILARAEEGAIVSTDFNHLPPSQRFFAGGVGSVRGYAYRSLAPVNKYGRVAGGKYLTTGSLELDWEVHRPFVAAAFVDAGGADDVINVRLHFSAGVGVRYLAPFGSIVLDLAHPFDSDRSPVRVEFSVRAGL